MTAVFYSPSEGFKRIIAAPPAEDPAVAAASAPLEGTKKIDEACIEVTADPKIPSPKPCTRSCSCLFSAGDDANLTVTQQTSHHTPTPIHMSSRKFC